MTLLFISLESTLQYGGVPYHPLCSASRKRFDGLNMMWFWWFSECPDFSFGEECIQCQCVRANTRFCNKTTGECICKNSYEGQTCSCLKGNHTCNLQTSICESGKCFCKHDNKAVNSSCFGMYIVYILLSYWCTRISKYVCKLFFHLCFKKDWD